MIKKITVANFVNKYDKLDSEEKSSFIGQHIVTSYVPYEEKCNICQRIINTSMKANGKFHQNTTAQYMLYTLQLIDAYTDITIDMSQSLKSFNMLDSRDLIDLILENIPEKEHAKFDLIIDMIRGDLFENERSIVGYIDRFLDRIKNLFDKIVESIDNSLDESTINKIKDIMVDKLK